MAGSWESLRPAGANATKLVSAGDLRGLLSPCPARLVRLDGMATPMEPDIDKIAEDVLALLFLTAHRDGSGSPWRAWKGHDWGVLDRLCEKGYIFDPTGRAKSVVFTDEGFAKAKELFAAKYEKKGDAPPAQGRRHAPA